VLCELFQNKGFLLLVGSLPAGRRERVKPLVVATSYYIIISYYY
jgi:hypothetical protein